MSTAGFKAMSTIESLDTTFVEHQLLHLKPFSAGFSVKRKIRVQRLKMAFDITPLTDPRTLRLSAALVSRVMNRGCLGNAHTILEVKQLLGKLVLGWVTIWGYILKTAKY